MKNEIKKIILEWQAQKLDMLFKRQGDLYFSEEINTVIGLRRSGKTYFLFSQIESLIQNGIDPSQIIYINFDDERLAEIRGKQLHWIIEAYYELYPGNLNKKIYLFLDEIQDIENWHLFIKRLYEQKKYHIVITCSSARLLSKEIASELRGRSLTIKFFPLSFREFLTFKNFPLSENIQFSQERFQLINYASEFLTYGGFPRVTMEPSHQRKKDLLTDYLDMIIFKDIVERYDVRNTHLLRAAIQVTYELNHNNTERELRGLKSALKELGLSKGTIITADTEDEIIEGNYHISIVPYWKWMII